MDVSVITVGQFELVGSVATQGEILIAPTVHSWKRDLTIQFSQSYQSTCIVMQAHSSTLTVTV